jgi:hypothetical protein
VNSQVLKGENDRRDSNENDKGEHDPRPRIAEIERVADAEALLHKQFWVGGINIKNANLPAAVRRAVVATRQYRKDSTASNATGARINKIRWGASSLHHFKSGLSWRAEPFLKLRSL